MKNKFYRSISITQKHFLYFLILGIGSIILVGTYSYHIAKNAILERTFNQLTSVRVEKTKSINRFLDDRINEISTISQTKDIKELYRKNTLLINSNSNMLNKFFTNNQYFKKLIIFDFYGNYIDFMPDSFTTSYTPFEINKIDSTITRQIKENPKPIIQDYQIGSNQDITFFVGMPIFEQTSNLLEGVIVFEINTNAINHIMFDSSMNNGLGRTGEAYIVGSDFLLRSSSRFQDNSIKKVKVETVASKSSLDGLSGQEIIDDYRGIEVLSSYAPFSFLGLKWGIIAEIDLEEALTPVYNLQNSIIILSIVLSILVFALVYYGSSKLTKPVIELKDAAIKISNGDYKLVIENYNRDEIGDLVQAFNDMSKQLLSQSEQIKQDNLMRIQSVIDAQEQERQRLSRDLHDGSGQMLLAIKLKIEQIKLEDNSKNSKYLKEASELIKNTIAEIRTISEDLTPVVLSNFGLEEGIKTLCRDTFHSKNIETNLICENLNKVFIKQKNQIYIYRILQEAINNILKHSSATKVSIRVIASYNQLLIQIQDNGKGFDNNSKYFGSGLKNIEERTQMLEGKMELISTYDGGTKIIIIIPIKNEKN